MKSFCPHCGAHMAYAGPKPKFCSSCGGSLNSFSTSHKKPEKEIDEDGNPNVPKPKSEESIPQIDNLEIEIQAHPPRANTLGQILETYSEVQPSPSSLNDASPPTSVRISQEQFLKEFKREAGSLREKK